MGERLYLHRHSVIHSLPSHSKIVAAFFFIVIAVSTPIQRWEAFVGFFLVLFLTVAAAKSPFTLLFTRALIEIPFILFALLMPFFGTGVETATTIKKKAATIFVCEGRE